VLCFQRDRGFDRKLLKMWSFRAKYFMRWASQLQFNELALLLPVRGQDFPCIRLVRTS
jgi:hypothetical protein